MSRPVMTLIAAMSENRVISNHGRIPWDLPRDRAHFRAVAAGKLLLLGRRTFAQMSGWFQPGHRVIVLSRSESLPEIACGASFLALAGSVEAALETSAAAGAEELLVCGGGQVYAAALPFAQRIILTTVHVSLPGDVTFPEVDATGWRTLSTVRHEADAEHAFAMSISRLVRSE